MLGIEGTGTSLDAPRHLMKKPDLPANESARIAALCSLDILDTPPELRFDRITRIAQRHFKVPIALVSLVDSERQWFKSRPGLNAPETHRDISFCGHAILSEDIFYVPNALDDVRFADNPLVTGELNLRFYAGAPLHSPSGERIGTLCLIDQQPRQFSPDELSVLRDLADSVEAELARTRLLQDASDLGRFKHVLDNTHDMIFMFDSTSLQFNYLNEGAVTNLGYTKGELLKMHPFDIKPEFPEPKFRTLIEPLRAGDATVLNFETVHRRKDGQDVPVSITLQLVQEANGSKRFVAIVHDITARRQAELAVTLLVERLSIATRAGGIGVWDWDIINNTLTWDDRMFALYGTQRDEFGGAYAAWLAGVHSDDRPRFDEAIQKALRNEAHYDIEFRTRWPDGKIRDIKADGQVLWDAHGAPMRMTGVNYDITERKQAEENLHAVTSLRQAILDSANFSIISTDGDGLIQTFNRSAERMLGYRAGELVGKHTPAIIHDPAEVAKRARELSAELNQSVAPGFEVFVAKARRGLMDEREWTYIRKDGTRFPVMLSITPLRNSAGTINGFLGIGSDITERKNVERLKSEFISTVSHELRTPLTSIRGALNLVLGKAAHQLPDKAQRMLEVAERNSERLTLLINDILDLEKIEVCRLEFEFKSIDLCAVAARALEDNEGYARKHNVHLRLESQVPQALVWADEHRLLQVCANLISNAVKYSPPDHAVTLSLTARDATYRLAVRDSGAGIPDEFRSRIFQRFAQADSSDTRSKGGTGLGLSIAKAIVERHGGTVDYTSQAGLGTEFFVDLPAHRAVTATAEAAADTPGAARVLICEDNPDVAQILSDMVEDEGVTCDRVGSAADASRMLARHAYRLMLLDLTLPDHDGLAFLHELRDAHAKQHLPVIVVSGRAHEARAAFKDGASTVIDWIQKPVQQERLTRALHAALRLNARPRVLHVEDDADVIQVTQALFDGAVDFTYAGSLHTARHHLSQQPFDLVILDLGLADGSGLDLLDELKNRCPVVIFSAQTPSQDVTDKVAAALTKSITTNEQLLQTIQRLLQREEHTV